jgi:hypothetical protein
MQLSPLIENITKGFKGCFFIQKINVLSPTGQDIKPTELSIENINSV